MADPTSFNLDNVAYFAAGKCAMLIRGAWARSDIPSDKGGSTLKWAAMPFVAGPEGEPRDGCRADAQHPEHRQKQGGGGGVPHVVGQAVQRRQDLRGIGSGPSEHCRSGLSQNLGW